MSDVQIEIHLRERPDGFVISVYADGSLIKETPPFPDRDFAMMYAAQVKETAENMERDNGNAQ